MNFFVKILLCFSIISALVYSTHQTVSKEQLTKFESENTRYARISSQDRFHGLKCDCWKNGKCVDSNCVCDPGYGEYEAFAFFRNLLRCEECKCGRDIRNKTPFNCTFTYGFFKYTKNCECNSDGYKERSGICRIDDPCIALIPCQNGGTCKKIDAKTYDCFCPETTTGKTCETILTTLSTNDATSVPTTSGTDPDETTIVDESTTETTVDETTVVDESTTDTADETTVFEVTADEATD